MLVIMFTPVIELVAICALGTTIVTMDLVDSVPIVWVDPAARAVIA